MSDDDERDPYGETQSASDLPGVPDLPREPDPFDAFRARRAQERAQQEEGYAAAPLLPPVPQPYEYTQMPAPEPFASAPNPPRRRLRSVIVFGGVAALVVGVGAGVWAVTSASGGAPAAAAGTPAASAPASPGSKAAKDKKAVTARLTVTAVSADSFTGTSAHGQTVVVHITSDTRFGTAERPFTRSQLVDGAKVVAHLRKEADGTVVATVIAGANTTSSQQPSAGASTSSDGA